MKKHTTKEVAKQLGVCEQRIRARIKQGHFPHAKRCDCGQSWLIPERDLQPKTGK